MKTIKSLFSGALITLLCLFVNATTSNAQSSTNDFRRIKTIQTIQIKKDLYVLNLNMTVPLFSEPLQRYLSSKMFKNEDSLLLSAINDYIEQHRPEENKLSRSKVDTLDFELYSVSYKPDKYISMFMRYPDIHSLANVSDGIYEIRDCIKSFIYDLKKDRILNYSDIFSPQYFF